MCWCPTHRPGPNVAKSQSPLNFVFFSWVSHLVQPVRFVMSRRGSMQGHFARTTCALFID